MNKHMRLLGLAFALYLVAVPVTTSAQQPDKLPRLGWLQNHSPTAPHYEGFREGLRELGYVEGKNLTVEARWADGDLDRLPELARELVHLNVNAMFVAGDQGLRAAKEATSTIPIVVLACDPLDSLVASIARPGGKATGLTCISSELAAKRLQLLKELVPALARVAILYNPEDRNKLSEYEQIQGAARTLKLTVRAFEARSVSSMSALGHSRPVEGPPVAGACPLRSESGHALASSICPLCAKSDLTQCSKLRLLDHLVGPGEERRWHVEAHRLAVLQVDHQVKLGRPLNRRRGFDPSSLCRLSSHTSLREEP